MEHKTWLWRKKSSEKTPVTSKTDIFFKGILDETLLAEENVGSERSERSSNEKLAPNLYESNAKYDLVTIHVNTVEEAIAGREKAEAELVSLKQERDEALLLVVAANERLTQLEVSSKESMQQLASVKQEEEQKIKDAVTKTSRDFDKMRRILEEKLRDASERLASLAADNSQLSNTLQDREELIKDLHKCKSQSEAEFKALLDRLDSTEKENTFLKYEYRMLEKEVEIRSEEREFNRKTADALQKQQVESVKKMTKLETECQRLRSLLRKRMPGPSAFAKIRDEVEMLGRDQTQTRRRKSDPTTGGLSGRGNSLENSPENPSKKIGILIERLCDMEEENKILKEIITEKNNELHDTKIVCAQTSSKLTHTEAQLRELSRGQKSMELAKCSPKSNELFQMPGFEVGNDDQISSSGSWANALVSELEHFRCKSPHKHTKLGVADMSLMDDFVEMEKLAIVSVDMPLENSHVSSSASNAIPNNMEKDSVVFHSHLTGKELVPVAQDDSSFGDTERKIQTVDGTTRRPCDWIQDVLKTILEENRVSGRSFDELLEDIRIALLYVNHPKSRKGDAATISRHPGESDPLRISGYITWKSPPLSPVENSVNEVSRINDSIEERQIQQTADGPVSGSDKVHVSKEVSSILPHVDFSNGQNVLIQMQETQSNLQQEFRGLRNELNNMEFAKKDLEWKLQSTANKNEALMKHLQESEQRMGRLQTELETMKASKGMIEDQIENQNSINEDLDTQLIVAKAKLNEVIRKFSSLEVELEDKCNSCEELESTCLELQLQLESATPTKEALKYATPTKKEALKYNTDQEEKQMQTGWEITTASAKLAECQETILNLGKQLKALASPREVTLFNKVFSTDDTMATNANNKNLSNPSSLRNQMLADDDAKAEVQNSPKTKELISGAETKNSSVLPSNNCSASGTLVVVEPPQAYIGSKHRAGTAGVGPLALAIVHSKKQKGAVGFLRKLLLRRKKVSSSKTSLTFGKV